MIGILGWAHIVAVDRGRCNTSFAVKEPQQSIFFDDLELHYWLGHSLSRTSVRNSPQTISKSLDSTDFAADATRSAKGASFEELRLNVWGISANTI